METIESRLKEERKRMGLSQVEAAALAGLNRTAQVRYEKGERAPDSRYLQALAAAGMDVYYVITGMRHGGLSNVEASLIEGFRKAPPQLRDAAIAVLGVSGEPAKKEAPAEFSIGGSVSQVVKAKKFKQSGAQFTLNAESPKQSKSPK